MALGSGEESRDNSEPFLTPLSASLPVIVRRSYVLSQQYTTPQTSPSSHVLNLLQVQQLFRAASFQVMTCKSRWLSPYSYSTWNTRLSDTKAGDEWIHTCSQVLEAGYDAYHFHFPFVDPVHGHKWTLREARKFSCVPRNERKNIHDATAKFLHIPSLCDVFSNLEPWH